MPKYTLNKKAVAHARELIEARRYVLNSDWGESQPSAEDENKFLDSHSWDDYAEWRHKEIELAAHDLLQLLDKKSG